MAPFDLLDESSLYHGGSFNGNLLGMIAGEMRGDIDTVPRCVMACWFWPS